MTKNSAFEQIQKDLADREKGYRAKALKMYPHICGSCTRAFEGKSLKELTVHHKDHNHDNNPPDGSNWELLCVYCHDNEHEKHKMKGYGKAKAETFKSKGFSAFGGLDSLFPTAGKDENNG
jgi:hypothetical protein